MGDPLDAIMRRMQADMEAMFFSSAYSTSNAAPEPPGVLTMDKLLDACRELRPVPPSLRFVEAHAAMVETDDRLFPASRHRSARIRKKLIKRFGGEFRKKPAAYQVGNTVFAHPAIMAQVRARVPEGRHG